MDTIRKVLLGAAERLVEIDNGQLLLLRHAFQQRNDLPLDDLLGNSPPVLVNRYRLAQPDFWPGGKRLEMIHQGGQVDRVLHLVFPILRLGIVGSQLDDHDMGLELGGRLESAGSPIGMIALLEEGGPADAKVSAFVPGPQQAAKHLWIVVLPAIGHTGSIGDAVSHTGNANHLRGANRCRLQADDDRRQDRIFSHAATPYIPLVGSLHSNSRPALEWKERAPQRIGIASVRTSAASSSTRRRSSRPMSTLARLSAAAATP